MNELERKHLKSLSLEENAFTGYNHMTMEQVEKDRVVYRLDVHPESLNPYGMVHGGALYTLADDAAGTAAHQSIVGQTSRPHDFCPGIVVAGFFH